MNMTRRGFVVSILAAGAAATGLLFVGGAFPKNAIAAEAGGKKALVIFYSWSGNTRSIAARIHQKVGGDLVERSWTS